MPSAIATKFGLRDLANTVVAVTDQDQSTYYSFDNPSGLSNHSWIQLDFGYAVDLKYFRLIKNAGCIGDFVVVCSNNPATNGTDYFVAGDVMTSVFRDLATGTPPDANYNGTITRTGSVADGTGKTAGSPNISYFSMPPTSARYRYYRIVPAGTLGISSDLALNELAPDIAVGVKVVGFPSSPTDAYKTVDGDLATYWTPVAASFASERVIPIGSPFTTLTEILPFIQFDFGEPVSLAALFCDAVETVSGTVVSATPGDGWHHIFSQGDRTATKGTGFYVGTVVSSNMLAHEFQTWDFAFAPSNNGPYYTGTPTTADYFRFQFSEATAITGFRFWDGAAVDLGNWAVDGSNDGSTWTNVCSTFHWNMTSTGILGAYLGCEILWTNTTPYLYYRLRYLSGSFGGGRLCQRLHLKINHDQLGGGDRTSLITLTAGPTGLSSRGGEAVTALVDGKYQGGYPTSDPGFNLNGASIGDSFKFNFGGHKVTFQRWVWASSGGQFSSTYGTWQWYGSNDDVTYTACGSSWVWVGSSTANDFLMDSTKSPASTDHYSFWELRFISGTCPQMNGLFEIAFDLTDYGGISGGTHDETSTGALGDCHLVASMFDVGESAAWDGATHLDVDIAQALRADISSGVALTTNLSPDAKYRYYRLVFGQNAGPNGDKILEFKFALQTSLKYIESDYHSLFSVGDRIANGMMATGTTGFLSVVGDPSNAFDNNFSQAGGNHFQVGAGDTPAGSLWWWDFGAFPLEIDGLAWSSASGVGSSTNGTFELVGGINPTTYWPTSYANEFAETSWSQTGSFQPVPPTVELDFTPSRGVPWPFYAFRLTSEQASYTGSWLADEMFIKVRHSNLDGGDRRNLGGTRPDKYVAITTDSSVGFGTIDTTHLDATGLLDGVYEYQNAGSGGAKGKYSYIQTVSGSSPKQLNTVGQWIRFQFPRKVTPLHLCFVVDSTKETYSGGNPVSYGKWHWEYSDNGTTWTSIGSQWSFTEGCYFMVAPRQSALTQGSSANAGFGLDTIDFTGHLNWRMVLDAGPAFGTGAPLAQVMFNLRDSGNTQTFISTNYSDGDTGDSLQGGVPTITDPAPPFSGVAFSDNVDDALSATLTITRSLFLRVNFDDGGEFDAYSNDLQPRSVTQTVTFITGK